MERILTRFLPFLIALGLLIAPACTTEHLANDYALKLVPLIDPAKLATLGARGANPRVQKATWLLSDAAANGIKPGAVIEQAQESLGILPQRAALTKAALLRNLKTAQNLGCLDPAGMAEMARGRAATIQNGPYAGDQLSVDHIIPRAVCPELDNVMANLELMPQRLNSTKRDRIGDRQRSHAKALFDAGLLSAAGLARVGSR
jgi:hypothetical protein